MRGTEERNRDTAAVSSGALEGKRKGGTKKEKKKEKVNLCTIPSLSRLSYQFAF
jgi:hypothetical protein